MYKSDFHTIRNLNLFKSFSILCFKCWWVNTRVDKYKKLEETIHVHVRLLSQDSTFNLFNFFPIFFPKFELPNSGCGLSASAAYMPVITITILTCPTHILQLFWKKPTGDNDSFQLLLFFIGNGCSPEEVACEQPFPFPQRSIKREKEDCTWVEEKIGEK